MNKQVITRKGFNPWCRGTLSTPAREILRDFPEEAAEPKGALRTGPGDDVEKLREEEYSDQRE